MNIRTVDCSIRRDTEKVNPKPFVANLLQRNLPKGFYKNYSVFLDIHYHSFPTLPAIFLKSRSSWVFFVKGHPEKMLIYFPVPCFGNLNGQKCEKVRFVMFLFGIKLCV